MYGLLGVYQTKEKPLELITKEEYVRVLVRDIGNINRIVVRAGHMGN